MDKDTLFVPRLAEEDLPLPGVGVVRVRGLDREESIAIAKIEDLAERDRHIIALGMVDPAMSVSEVKRWGKAAPGGELERVSRAIHRLSRMGPDADKETYKSVPDESGAGVRTLPSGKARPNRRRAARVAE